jgi:hypothetical protein
MHQRSEVQQLSDLFGFLKLLRQVDPPHHGRQLSDYAIDKQSLEEERKTRFNISWEAN